MESSNTKGAGPSNPAKLLVRTRDPTSSSSSGAASSAVKASLARKSEQVRKAEKWGDRMMEETISSKEFKRGIKYISPSAYAEIEHERHLNHLCSYPLCSKSPRREYRQGAHYSISTTKRSIKEVEGNREDGFCSKGCQERSGWIAKQLDKRRESGEDGVEIRLFEEIPIEEQEGMMAPRKGAGGLRAGARLRSDTPKRSTGMGDASPGSTGISGLETLVGDITIRERPTPDVPPQPPSLDPAASKPPATQSSVSQQSRIPTSTRSASSSSKPTASPRRAAGSALVSTPTKLVSSILSSSRQSQGKQLEPDSDSSSTSGDPDEENPLGMGGWSEDEDVRALFEEARAARELMSDREDT